MKRFHTKHFAKDLRGMEKEREKKKELQTNRPKQTTRMSMNVQQTRSEKEIETDRIDLIATD